ncbi:endoplasmic reticulum-Golgi intermediate compartment protein 2 [Anthonomus grandis grandis]|uniref:endoplasmic reticulum-Golgi intermediate compartment protein 2 n=1 Tax=Anthonomus grandis grandis TaxID=2921223 RepID=UPI002166371D|nr:endoplasmic reticulum-Golgi intermediate compartment protein 2 [Anthonomus grandis grandis]
MESEKVSIPRYRGSKLNKVKKMDIFPKIEDPYKIQSSVGGSFSIISFLIIAWLVYSEVSYYLNSSFTFKFSPDIELDEKLKMNIDLTVAMPCGSVGTDVLDSTNQNTYKFGQLEEEDTWFELSENQQLHFENKKHINSYLREEYHAVKDLLWKSSFSSQFGALPPRSHKPNRPFDACRIYGSLLLNKVAGNFHITAGKSISLPRGHIHISAFISDQDYNFTHRIDRFSFGDPSPGLIHPLEGDERVFNHPMTLVNYFIEVVPTTVKTFMNHIDTYQYSVKELARVINHDQGSHGMPGIYFKYDMSALRVTVIQERDNLGMFLAKLCSVVGGVYVCSGILNSVVQLIVNFITCNWTSKKPADGQVSAGPPPTLVTAPPQKL